MTHYGIIRSFRIYFRVPRQEMSCNFFSISKVSPPARRCRSVFLLFLEMWQELKILTLSGNKKGTQLSWGVKTKPVELSKKLKQIWVALSILIWAVTLQKIDRTKVSGPKMRSKVKILIWNWWKLAKSTILLPGPNKCTHFQMGATTKLEEISKMLRCLFVALYMQFLVDPTTYPKFPIVSLLSQWQQRKSKIQHFHSKFLLPKMTSAAIEIAGKLLGAEMSNTKIPTQYQYQYFWESS